VNCHRQISQKKILRATLEQPPPNSVPLTTRRRAAPCLPLNQLSVPDLDPKSGSHHTQTLTQPILASLLPFPVAVPRASLLTPARLNRHNRLPTGGSLQTAVSDAPQHRAHLHTDGGRTRYSTRVSGQCDMRVLLGALCPVQDSSRNWASGLVLPTTWAYLHVCCRVYASIMPCQHIDACFREFPYAY
jgi:hypothetical protein